MNIQQLRTQIATLQSATMDENKNFRSAYDEGKFDALSSVDALLDSLQEEGEPVSEDLEEEIQKTIYNHFFDLDGIAIVGATAYATVDDMVYIAKHFAKWQAEQIMSKAIDGEVGYWNLHGLSVNVDLPLSADEGDRVKVLVVKEE